jgi:hypothetical protein
MNKVMIAGPLANQNLLAPILTGTAMEAQVIPVFCIYPWAINL